MRLLALPVLFLAVGCGSDGTKKPMLLDAKVFLDAGADAAPVCGVKPDLGGLTLGSAQTPAGSAQAADWYEVFSMGTLAGKKYFDLAAGLPPSISGDATGDLLVVDLVEPTAGFTQGTAVTLNGDPNAATPAAYGYIFTDVNPQAQTFNKFLYASSGTITLTTYTNTSQNDGGITAGTVAGVNFREVDEMSGADVAGGCTTKLTQVMFTVKQTEIADMPFTGGGKALPESPLGESMRAAINAHKQQMELQAE